MSLLYYFLGHSVFLSLRKTTERISMKFAGGSHYHEKSKYYIFGEIGTGTTEQDTRENSNRRQSVSPRCQTGADA